MKMITQNGTGSVSFSQAIRDTDGSGLLPIQAEVVSGSPSFSVEARVSPDAPWVEIKAAGTVGFLESFSWVPYMRLVVTGTGAVNLYVAEK